MVAIFTTAGSTRSNMGARLGNGSLPTDAGNPAVAIGSQQTIKHAGIHRRKKEFDVIKGSRLTVRKRLNQAVERLCKIRIIPIALRG